ncbi:hypothetical protein SLEP1_g7227 [Rubroshorea leprosula]|uniref:Uncharacterized protein n=1 Tax=Rubroshorea leprosula TaxID=152421 RepID=A0AAV5I7L6_9ROSI|nr:hypothetical protein SLEP1_g7227 [Rubroshorea leprosula]
MEMAVREPSASPSRSYPPASARTGPHISSFASQRYENRNEGEIILGVFAVRLHNPTLLKSSAASTPENPEDVSSGKTLQRSSQRYSIF